MFNLFKRKNKVKELETRILVVECEITKLNAQKENHIDFNKSNTVNGDLVLQIDGSIIGKVALNQLKKMQNQDIAKIHIKEEFKGADNYEILKK